VGARPAHGAALDPGGCPVRIPNVHARSVIALVCAALVTGLVASAPAATRLERFDQLGISFKYPSNWFVTTERLSNGWDPDYRFAASTVPVKRTRDDIGPCLRGIDRQLPRNAALVFLREARSIDRRAMRRLGPLPRLRLSPDAVMPCMHRPSLGAWVHFREAGRAFVLGVHVGPRAPEATVRELRRLVASLDIRPRARLRRFDRLGISFQYASTWFVTTEPLSAASDPDYRFAASTVPVKRTRHDEGPCLPQRRSARTLRPPRDLVRVPEQLVRHVGPAQQRC